MKKWLAILFILFSFSGTSQILWKEYKDDVCKFEYPGAWRLVQEDSTGAHLFLFMPKTDEEDTFRENVNLIVQDLSQYSIGLKEFVSLSEYQVQNMIKESEILRSKTYKKKGEQHHEIEYTGEQNGRLLKFLQYYWVIDNKAYVLTYTAEPDHYEDYMKHIDMIFSSFEILESK